MADSAAWTLDSVAPTDNTFRGAGEEVHRAFWRWIAAIGVDRFHWRCNQGIGASGEPLTPIAESTAKRGRKRSYTGLGNAGNPPLVPALGLSRTEALLKGRGFVDHAEWYWTVDPVTGLHWGQMMLWHAAGGGGRYPARNVIGWSTADVGWLRAQGATWWYAYQHGHAIAEAMNEIETRQDKFPRLAAAAPKPGFFKVAKGARTDVENSVGSIGTAEMSRRAIAEGNATGFRVTSGGWSSPKGGGKAAPVKPAPTVPIPAKAAPAPKVRRPAAVAQPAAKAASKTAKPKPAAAKKPWVNPYDSMPALNPLAHERAPITRPVSAPIPATSGPPPDLATFAARAKAAAATVGREGRFGDRKVFINHAHSAYVRIHGPIPLPEYKDLLARSVQARHLDLSRADLVEAMDYSDVQASTVFHPMGMEFQFIRIGD